VSRILKGLAKSDYEPKEYLGNPGVACVKNIQGVSSKCLRAQRILKMYFAAIVCLIELD